MNKGHGRGRCRNNASKLTQVGKIDTNQLHRRAIFAISRHVHTDLAGKRICRLPVNRQTGGERVVISQINTV